MLQFRSNLLSRISLGTIETHHRGFNTRLREHSTGTINSPPSETERFFQGSTERMDQQFQRLDTALQQELEKSINSLGRQLASLSSRFVADYTPLTEQLRRVVQIARRLE